MGGSRLAARGLGARLRAAAAAQLQQRRAAGDLPVKTNKWVEEHGAARENVEQTFRWTRRSIANLVIFAGLVPYGILKYGVAEFERADAAAGRPRRDMVGGSAAPQ